MVVSCQSLVKQKLKKKDAWRWILKRLDSGFSRNKLHGFLCLMSFCVGGGRWSAVSREITPQWDDVGSCPSVSSSSCWAEVSLSGTLNLSQLRWRCTLSSTSWMQNRLENRIQPWRSIKYRIIMSSWPRVMWYDCNVSAVTARVLQFVQCFHVSALLGTVRSWWWSLDIVWHVCFHESASVLFLSVERRQRDEGGRVVSLAELRIYNSVHF